MTTYELFSMKTDLDNKENCEIKHIMTLPTLVRPCDNRDACRIMKKLFEEGNRRLFFMIAEYTDNQFVCIHHVVSPINGLGELPEIYSLDFHPESQYEDICLDYMNSRMPRSIVKNND